MAAVGYFAISAAFWRLPATPAYKPLSRSAYGLLWILGPPVSLVEHGAIVVYAIATSLLTVLAWASIRAQSGARRITFNVLFLVVWAAGGVVVYSPGA